MSIDPTPAPVYAEQRVTLGCGTLILIALIVLIFSNAGNDEIQKDLRKVKTELENVKGAISRLEEDVVDLRKAIEKQAKDAG